MSVKTFVERMEADFVKMWKAAPTFEQKAQSALAIVIPIATEIIEVADPAVGAIVGPIMSKVQTDLTIVQTVTSQGQVAAGTSAAQTLTTALTDVKNNMGSILTLAEVKNSTKVATITTGVNTVVAEMDVLVAALTPAVG